MEILYLDDDAEELAGEFEGDILLTPAQKAAINSRTGF